MSSGTTSCVILRAEDVLANIHHSQNELSKISRTREAFVCGKALYQERGQIPRRRHHSIDASFTISAPTTHDTTRAARDLYRYPRPIRPQAKRPHQISPHEMWRNVEPPPSPCLLSAVRMLPERHPVPQTSTPHDPLVWTMSIAVLRSHKKSRCGQAI
jgi:hypothetical protein